MLRRDLALLLCLGFPGPFGMVALGAGVTHGGDWVQDEPSVVGYVTRVGPGGDFDVDGLHVVLSVGSTFSVSAMGKVVQKDLPSPAQTPYLGQYAAVYGVADGRTQSVQASRITFFAPADATVKGTGIIDRVLAGNGEQRRIRADGRQLEISSAVLGMPAAAPAGVAAASAADLRTNVWVDYKGVQRVDGVVEIESASFADNAVSPGESRMLKKRDYDPAAVREEDKQSTANKFFRGFDPKKLPAYKDEAMQTRIDRMGDRLIPAYQKELPEGDVTKIRFRFQLVDEPKWHDAMTLPNGIILVPWQIVSRLKNDSQLAAVLADNIGTALEKQEFRQQKARRTMTGANIAGDVGGVVLPGLGVATGLVTYGVGKKMLSHAEQQSGRVALSLMHDAGYDVTQAPEAWWTLATKEAKDGTEGRRGDPPARAANQFEELGTTWRVTLAGQAETQVTNLTAGLSTPE